jgi:hypothetical protein
MHIKIKMPRVHRSIFVCGEREIRTLGTQKEFNGFRDRPVQPLRHLSVITMCSLLPALAEREGLFTMIPEGDRQIKKVPVAFRGHIFIFFAYKNRLLTLQKIKSRSVNRTLLICGKGGIRTLGTVTRTHALQACQFNHSCTFPKRDCKYKKLGLLLPRITAIMSI